MNHQDPTKLLLIGGAVLLGLVAFGAPIGYLGFPLLILACPLMMWFMMRSMGGMESRGSQSNHDEDADSSESSAHAE